MKLDYVNIFNFSYILSSETDWAWLEEKIFNNALIMGKIKASWNGDNPVLTQEFGDFEVAIERTLWGYSGYPCTEAISVSIEKPNGELIATMGFFYEDGEYEVSI